MSVLRTMRPDASGTTLPGTWVAGDLIQVANEYWITFYIDGNIYDKKVVFVQGAIHESYFTNIPVLEKRGVMIL